MTQPLLSVEDLRAEFLRDGQWQRVLNGVSFDLSQGETVAVVGESGSGKSVTAMSIMRLLPEKTSRVTGQILFDGQPLLRKSEAEMSAIRGNDIAMVFQESGLNPVYTIGFQLCEALMKHRWLTRSAARQESIELLERVRIPAARSRLDEYPHRLSGGMRQRVAIALALACQPRILIADEPTTALDVTIQAQIIELIKMLQDEEKMSVLFITHDMGVVAEVADRTVVMYRGDVVETGATASIFRQPQKDYTKKLLGAVSRFGAAASVIEAPPQTGNAEPALQVKDLVVRYDVRSGLFGRVSGRVHAVESVSFDLKPGETLSLVGESGCGKSTTARTIMGLVQPRSGEILLNGTNLVGKSKREFAALRQSIQMVFQDPYTSLNPRIPIGRAIAEPLSVHTDLSPDQIKTKVAHLLEQVGLVPSMMSRYPHEFSGGQRQRVCIARALALDPQVIVADEAVSALDVSVKDQVLELMEGLQSQFGLSYLFISHDMSVVERISHRVAVMYLGSIVEIGPRAAIFENPQHPYTKALLAAVPVPDPARRALRRGLDSKEIGSALRDVDYVPPQTHFQEVAPSHVVLR